MSPESSYTTWHNAPGPSLPAHYPVLFVPPSCYLFLFVAANSTQVPRDLRFSSTWGHASNNKRSPKTKGASLVGEGRNWLNLKSGF